MLPAQLYSFVPPHSPGKADAEHLEPLSVVVVAIVVS